MASPDWTTGPGKWGALIVVGSLAAACFAWSAWTHRDGIRVESVGPEAVSSAVAQPDQPALTPRLININTASAAELELLPGIGPALASRIVADRETRGPFTTIQSLNRVDGIGPKTIERLRDRVSVQ